MKVSALAGLRRKLTSIGGAKRLLVLLALLAGIPLVLLVVLPLQMAVGSLGKEATARVADTATVSAGAIAQRMDSISALAEGYAANEVLLAPSSIPMTDVANPTRMALRQLHDSNPSVRSVAVLDAGGHVLSAEPWVNVSLGRDLSYRDYYRGAVASEKPYVSEAFVSASAPNPKLAAVSMAIRGPADATGVRPIRGVLLVTVDVDVVFQTYVDNLQSTRGVELLIVDQNNHVVAAPGIGKEMVQITDDGIRRARAGDPSSGKRMLSGKHAVAAYDAVGTTGWVVSTSVPQNEAFHAIGRLRSNVYTLAAILGTVILFAVFLLARSIRARERSERDLRKTEERTRTIIDTARQAFCALDSKGTILEWNAQAEEVYGWTREEAIGQNCLELLSPASEHEWFSKFLETVSAGREVAPRSSREEGLALRKGSNEPFPIEFTLWLTEVDGELQVNAFSQDISERVAFEQERELVVKRQRRLVEELQAADKAKSDFIATISHELRTPLTSIVGYLEMLEEGYGGELTKNQTSMLDVIGRNSRRLLSLIEDVLTLSRIESGVFREDITPVDMHDLVESSMQALVPSARAKQLEVVIDVPRDVGTVDGDIGQLERALLNVMSNAIKFTPENGRISVHGYAHGDKVLISIADNGIGIPIEEQSKLFSRFFRSSTAHDQAIQGTGLGLTIVKSIVERHNGRVTIQSAKGKGTTVNIELPTSQLVSAD